MLISTIVTTEKQAVSRFTAESAELIYKRITGRATAGFIVSRWQGFRVLSAREKVTSDCFSSNINTSGGSSSIFGK